MSKPDIVLSLSGGGFRAMLFHLGVIRYLKHAGLLDHVNTIAAVSGGAIIAAHLCHNWEEFPDDETSFALAAQPLIRFAKRDVRGRILRRLPWALATVPIPWLNVTRSSLFRAELRKILGKRAELLTQALAASTSTPRLYILATNLTTGWSCSFSRDGFTQHAPEGIIEMKTEAPKTAFAVGVSASFPTFFPPSEVVASDLGVSREAFRFPKQYLTDGGVFDNLGIRAIQRLHQEGPQFDITIVSDGGAAFELNPGRRFTGIFASAARAVDILFHRVQNLEYELINQRESEDRSLDSDAESPVFIPIRITDSIPRDDVLRNNIGRTAKHANGS